jgi:hypothetical protein
MKSRVTFFIHIVTIALVLGGFTRVSQATMMTGNALATMCSSEKDVDLFSCQSYIAGVIDYHLLIKGLGTAPSVDFCIPAGVKMDDIRMVILEYFEGNNQHSTFVASPAVALALFDAFPCD